MLNQQQYEIMVNRRNIIQGNIGVMNDLYKDRKAVMKTGKALFSQTDPIKAKNYTFTELKKQVWRTSKKNTTEVPSGGIFYLFRKINTKKNL